MNKKNSYGSGQMVLIEVQFSHKMMSSDQVSCYDEDREN